MAKSKLKKEPSACFVLKRTDVIPFTATLITDIILALKSDRSLIEAIVVAIDQAGIAPPGRALKPNRPYITYRHFNQTK